MRVARSLMPGSGLKTSAFTKDKAAREIATPRPRDRMTALR
jgi:hypothetical protein